MPVYLKNYGRITKSDSTTAKKVVEIRKKRFEKFKAAETEDRYGRSARGTKLEADLEKQKLTEQHSDTTMNRALGDVKASQMMGGPIIDDVNAARRAIIEESRKLQFKKKKSK